VKRIKVTAAMLGAVAVVAAQTAMAVDPAQIGSFEVTEVAPGNYGITAVSRSGPRRTWATMPTSVSSSESDACWWWMREDRFRSAGH